MLIQDQLIELKARRKDVIEYYKNKGYDANPKKSFYVKAEDLNPNSAKEVEVICDYCGKKYKVPYRNYIKNVISSLVAKCACQKCGMKKQAEIHMLKYGVKNSMQRQEVKEKMRKTCLEKYGVENVLSSEEFQDKAKETQLKRYGRVSPFQDPDCQEKLKQIRMEKYGVEYMLQSEEVRSKAVKTFQEKYGGNTPMASEEIRRKASETCLSRYGTPSTLSSDEVLSKVSETRYINGTCHSSKIQKRLAKLFNGDENFPIGRYNVDLLLDDNIVLEYDGGAHAIDIKHHRFTDEEFKNKEKRRSKYIIDKGYSIIRFINLDDLEISDEKYFFALTECKKLLVSTKHVAFDFSTEDLILMF